jgi:predicted transcriptional regulator
MKRTDEAGTAQADTDISELPAAEDNRQEIEAVKQSRGAPIREARAKLEQQRHAINGKIAAVKALLVELEGGKAVVPTATESSRKRATKAQMAKREEELAKAAEVIYKRLAAENGQPLTARKLREIVASDMNISKAVQLWNQANQQKTISEDGKAAGRKYVVK